MFSPPLRAHDHAADEGVPATHAAGRTAPRRRRHPSPAVPEAGPERAGYCCDRAQGIAAIASPADYEAIATASQWLTHLSLELTASDTTVPQRMAGVLSACSKLEDLAIRTFAHPRLECVQNVSRIVDIDALAACTQLLSLQLPWCYRLHTLQSLAAMANLHSLVMSGSSSVSDLSPLADMVKLQSLDINRSASVSDLAPLAAM